MRRMAHLAVVFGAITCSMLLTGCAFGDRNVALQYSPVVSAQTQAKTRVGVVKFADERQADPKQVAKGKGIAVGEVRNGYGMKTASVYANGQDIGGWVANALADELAAAGVEVAKFTDVASPDTATAISGEVTEVYVKMFMTARATVRARITVTRAGVPVLNKEYVGKNSKLAVTAGTGEYEGALRSALQDLMKQMVPEVIGVI